MTVRVLVTGHKGYIGTVLTPMLTREGYDVVGYDSDLYERCTFGADAPAVSELRKDLRDVTAADLEGIDAVLHLAALSNDPLGNINPDLTFDINAHASIRLATMARDAGVQRFVFSSSCSNYGAGGDDMIDEGGAFNPVTPYGESKVMVEKTLSEMADDNFSPILLRNATAYGVSPRMRFDLVLNNLVAWAVTTGQVMLKSDGSPWRPIVHIEDISRAFVAALRAPRERVHNQAFNVGRTRENFRISELAEIVRDTVPGTKIEFAPDAGPDKRNYRVDCSKVERQLPEFEPQWDARRGAVELRDAYQAIGLTLEEFEGPRYKRIDHIKMLIAEGVIDESLRRRDQAAGHRA
jgi:nucleoside-diphosphate-sugar epimerase